MASSRLSSLRRPAAIANAGEQRVEGTLMGVSIVAILGLVVVAVVVVGIVVAVVLVASNRGRED